MTGVSYLQAMEALPERVAEKIAARDDGSWVWLGTRLGGGKGYGGLTFKGVVRRAHIFVYQRLVGPVPAGLELDHLCFETMCVNAENMRRYAARFTHCSHGHEWTEANTYRSPSKGRRECRACNREKQRLRYWSRRDA